MNGKNTFWGMDENMVLPERHHWLHCGTGDLLVTQPPTVHKFIWANQNFTVSGTSHLIAPLERTFKNGSHLQRFKSKDSDDQFQPVKSRTLHGIPL